MNTNNGNMDPMQSLDGRVDNEIVRLLLDNDDQKLGDVVYVSLDGMYVEIKRRIDKRDTVEYKRVEQKQLRRMTEEERRTLNKSLTKSSRDPMIYSYEYDQSELAQLRRKGNGLANLLKGLSGNGYSVVRARVYQMPEFDTKTPIVVTKLHQVKGNSNISEQYYMVESMAGYIKMNHTT